MEGVFSTEQAADYIEAKSGGAITRRAVIWYIRDKRGRDKAAREGVLQGEKIGQSRVFTQAQLDDFIAKYPQMSSKERAWETRRQKQKE
ncbi:MAG: hypothetical protein ABI690_13465 [Chloroflexota bacterium]